MIERAMGQSLRLLNRFAGSRMAERFGLLEPAERLLYDGTRKSLQAAQKLKSRRPRRPRPEQSVHDAQRLEAPSGPGLFDLTPTDSQRLVVDTMARFAQQRLRPAAPEADEACAAPEGLLDEAHELGLTLLAVPESLGGAAEERSTTTYALAAEALARGDMGLAVAALAPASVAHALVEWGTAEQQGKLLPALLGEQSYPVALALLEPHPLADPRRLRTQARRDGDGYVLDGVKSLVPLAADAEWLLVVASLDGQAQAFVVDRDAEGLTVEAEPSMGVRAAALGRVTLAGVRVEAGGKLGGDAGIDVQRLIDLGRIAWSALAVGTSQAMLDYVTEYCNERIAFGEPITHRQSVAFLIADIAVELQAMRLMVWRAASRAEQGLSFTREAALARVQCADKGMFIGTSGVQLLGGHGFIKEHPVELWYRHLRAVAVMEGALLV